MPAIYAMVRPRTGPLASAPPVVVPEFIFLDETMLATPVINRNRSKVSTMKKTKVGKYKEKDVNLQGEVIV